MADWSQLLTGGAVGAVLTWVGGLAKSGFDHWLAQRKARFEEERMIRGEAREAARKEAENQRIANEQLAKDDAVLTMYKTRLNGTRDLQAAASIVGGIHNFFGQRPQYIATAENRAFLEKYTKDLCNQVQHHSAAIPGEEQILAQLKADAETLRLTH